MSAEGYFKPDTLNLVPRLLVKRKEPNVTGLTEKPRSQRSPSKLSFDVKMEAKSQLEVR